MSIRHFLAASCFAIDGSKLWIQVRSFFCKAMLFIGIPAAWPFVLVGASPRPLAALCWIAQFRVFASPSIVLPDRYGLSAVLAGLFCFLGLVFYTGLSYTPVSSFGLSVPMLCERIAENTASLTFSTFSPGIGFSSMSRRKISRRLWLRGNGSAVGIWRSFCGVRCFIYPPSSLGKYPSNC